MGGIRTFNYAFGKPDKRAVSPHRFPLLRSGSVAIRQSSISRPTTPVKSRAITPKRVKLRLHFEHSLRLYLSRFWTFWAWLVLFLDFFPVQYPSEPRRSASVRVAFEKETQKETEQQQQPSKSKRLLKALLSRRKTKKDDTLYTYLDEYWTETGFFVCPLVNRKLHFSVT